MNGRMEKTFKTIYFCFVYVWVPVYIYVHHMHADVWKGKETVLDPVKLEWEVTVSSLL